jgi:hypothetical protein
MRRGEVALVLTVYGIQQLFSVKVGAAFPVNLLYVLSALVGCVAAYVLPADRLRRGVSTDRHGFVLVHRHHRIDPTVGRGSGAYGRQPRCT